MKATRREILALAAIGALGAWPASAETGEPARRGAGRIESGGLRPGLGAGARPLLRFPPQRPRLAGGARRASVPKRASARSREEAAVVDQRDAGEARRLPHPLLHAGGSGLLSARRHFRRRARASRPRAGLPEGGSVLSGNWRVHRGRQPGPHLRNRRDRGRARACGRRSARRRNPVGGRSSVPPGRLVPRQGRIARLASDPPRVRRGADRDQRIAGRSSPERDVPARPQSERAGHRHRTRPNWIRACLVLCEPQDSVRARGPDVRRPAQGRRCAGLGSARRMGRRAAAISRSLQSARADDADQGPQRRDRLRRRQMAQARRRC